MAALGRFSHARLIQNARILKTSKKITAAPALNALPAVRAKSCKNEASAEFSTPATNIRTVKTLIGENPPAKNAQIAKRSWLKEKMGLCVQPRDVDTRNNLKFTISFSSSTEL